MKKLTILSTTILFLLAFSQVKADNLKRTELKSEIKVNREDMRMEKKELRTMAENSVSDMTKDDFYSDFGSVPNVKWIKNGYFDVADFTKKGKDVKAFYDYNSKLIGTTTMKTFADLPAKAQKTIKKEYRKYRIGDVIYFADNQNNDTDMVLWDTQFEDADNYFVELRSQRHHIIVQVNPEGEVFFFKDLNV